MSDVSTRSAVLAVDPVFGAPGATEFVERAQAFGNYRLYLETDPLEAPYGAGLLPRHDAVLNFLNTRVGEDDDLMEVAVRTSYFREEYAYGDRDLLDGVETLRNHPGFIEAARSIHDLPVIEPAIVYANLFLPAQELAVHTDVPEFRGVNRKVAPQWLMVVMLHSGLFEQWRLPIATAISYFGDSHGADLLVWPDGPAGHVTRIDAAHDTAAALDTDSVFHGVAPVAGGSASELPPLGDGAHLEANAGTWRLVDAAGTEKACYDWDDFRFSVSWKAYCFADDADRRRWMDHTEDLDVDAALALLVDDLAERGHDTNVDDPGLGLRLIEEYIHFPTTA